MAIETIEVWPFAPNWNSEVREVLSWLTEILASPSGAEQRRSLREFPRRTVEYSILVDQNERTYLDNLIMSNGASDMYMPLWFEVHIASANSGVGETFIRCQSAASGELKVGDVLFISSLNPFDFQLVEVASISNIGINLISALIAPINQGSFIFPVRKARLTDQPRIMRHSDNTATAQVRFMIVDANEDFNTSPSTAEYAGYALAVTMPEDNENLDYGYSRILEEFDNNIALPIYVDTGRKSFTIQKFSWTLEGRESHAAFRQFIYKMKGMCVPIWLPTFFADFTMVESAAAGSTTVRVANTRFSVLGGQSVNREHVIFFMRDGSFICRKILGAVEVDADTETLLVDTPFSAGLEINNLLRISFLTLVRMNQDQIEILHQTDSEGVSIVDTTFKSSPNIRQVQPGF